MVTRTLRSLALLLVVAGAPVGATACSKKAPEITAETIADQGALTEQHEAGTVTLAAAPDGHVKLLVKDSAGKPLESGVSGTLAFKAPVKGTKATAELTPEPKSGGVLGATLPAFEEELTELAYDVKAGPGTMKGIVHVPRGGTHELEESAKKAEPDLEKKAGPNGGIVQVVGDDTVEIVADKATGEVRAYVLDGDLKPTEIGEREIKLGVTTPGDAEVVVLTPGPGRAYFTGKLPMKVNPTKITVVVTEHGHHHVALCRHHPGQVIVVGPNAPVINILVVTPWNVVVQPAVVVQTGGPRVIVVHKGKGKGKFHFKKK